MTKYLLSTPPPRPHNTGVFMIKRGLWGIFNYTHNKEALGNYLYRPSIGFQTRLPQLVWPCLSRQDQLGKGPECSVPQLWVWGFRVLMSWGFWVPPKCNGKIKPKPRPPTPPTKKSAEQARLRRRGWGGARCRSWRSLAISRSKPRPGHGFELRSFGFKV